MRQSRVTRMGASTSSNPATNRIVNSSSWKIAGSIGPMGAAVSRPATDPRITGAPTATGERRRSDLVGCSMLLHPHVVLVGEEQAVGVQFELLRLLAAFPGDGVGAEEPGVLDHVHAADALQQPV